MHSRQGHTIQQKLADHHCNQHPIAKEHGYARKDAHNLHHLSVASHFSRKGGVQGVTAVCLLTLDWRAENVSILSTTCAHNFSATVMLTLQRLASLGQSRACSGLGIRLCDRPWQYSCTG